MSGFECENCDLDEDEINSYDATEFAELLELLSDHNIEPDRATNSLEAKNLLFEHLKQRDNPDGAQSVRTDVVRHAVSEHHTRREQLLKCSQDVKNYISQLPNQRRAELKRYFPSYEKDLERVIKELKVETCQFIVAGETGSGKSRFINLLLGRTDDDFLPVSVVPSTSCLCEIMYGERAQLHAFSDNQVKEISLTEGNVTSALSEFTHQKENRDKVVYSRVEVRWPLDWLQQGLVIVDTPGVGESAEITAMVKERMPKAYGFIYVINTTKAGGIQQDELEDLLLKPATQSSSSKGGMNETYLSDSFDPKTAIFVFNKWDLIDNEERDKIRKFAIDKIRSIYGDIDPENQIFFLSTQQAATTLQSSSYVTEEYRKVLNGIERLMDQSMRSKMGVYYDYLVQLISRLAFILRVYLGNFEEFQQKYDQIKSRLEQLTDRHQAVEQKLKDTLAVEVEKIITKLEEYLNSPATIKKLCTWDFEDLPREIRDWQLKERLCRPEKSPAGIDWRLLERLSQAACKKRVEDAIKQWESEMQAIQMASRNLLQVFQSEFDSLRGYLASVEMDLLSGEVSEKDMKRVMRDINISVMNQGGVNFGIKEMAVLGVLSPILLPVGLVVSLVASPVLAIMAIRNSIRSKNHRQDYYQGYLTGSSGTVTELMATETKVHLDKVTASGGVKAVIEERMQDLVNKMLQLVQKIPDFISADKAMLSNLKSEMDEGVKEKTKQSCETLYQETKKLQLNLDNLYLMHIHENDFTMADITTGHRLGSGSFGNVFEGTLKLGQETIDVAVKKPRGTFYPGDATDIKLEDFNMRKPSHDNIVKYYGLCMVEEEASRTERNCPAEKSPHMVMELCHEALDNVIYDKQKYTAPANFQIFYTAKVPDDTGERASLYKMADFSMQIAGGLKALHELGLVHRDLKPANILVKYVDNNGVKMPVLKLCDFGLSRMEDEAKTSAVGTVLYMAPEVLGGKTYDRSADLFSYGLILVELFFGVILNKSAYLKVDIRPTKFKEDPFQKFRPPPNWERLIRKCISDNPTDRPTIQQCFQIFEAQLMG